MKSTIIFVAVVALCIFGILIAFADMDPVGVPLRLDYQSPLTAPISIDDASWLSQKRGILKRFFAEELKEAIDDMNDQAKMKAGLATARGGQPVGSIGVFLGLAISELVKRLIYLLIVSILTAILLAWLKSYWMPALIALAVYVGFQIAFTYIVARSAARRVLEKTRV